MIDDEGTGLGDVIGRALAAVGLTPARVERFLGAPCGCAERRARLNQVGWWARRVLAGRNNAAAAHLDATLAGGGV